jgi:hypothetical protein
MKATHDTKIKRISELFKKIHQTVNVKPMPFKQNAVTFVKWVKRLNT